mmetsp:Transcript_11648/g.23002  ORF Transcript_11648/g.23002 Transcript_11648/m.23002 type:complete len:240 (-) Transcript_11648:609-1328(-)
MEHTELMRVTKAGDPSPGPASLLPPTTYSLRKSLSLIILLIAPGALYFPPTSTGTIRSPAMPRMYPRSRHFSVAFHSSASPWTRQGCLAATRAESCSLSAPTTGRHTPLPTACSFSSSPFHEATQVIRPTALHCGQVTGDTAGSSHLSNPSLSLSTSSASRFDDRLRLPEPRLSRDGKARLAHHASSQGLVGGLSPIARKASWWSFDAMRLRSDGLLPSPASSPLLAMIPRSTSRSAPR